MATLKRWGAVKVIRHGWRKVFGVKLRVTNLSTGEQTYERSRERVWTRNV